MIKAGPELEHCDFYECWDKTRIYNLTPHTIVLENTFIKYVIPPSGLVIRCDVKEEIVSSRQTLQVVKRSFGEPVGMPDHYPGVSYIVSNPLLERLPGRMDCFAPDTGNTAKRENGQVVSVSRLIAAPGVY